MLEKKEEKRFGGGESLKNERIAKKKEDHRFAWHNEKKNAAISQTGKKSTWNGRKRRVLLRVL